MVIDTIQACLKSNTRQNDDSCDKFLSVQKFAIKGIVYVLLFIYNIPPRSYDFQKNKHVRCAIFYQGYW